MAVRSDEVFGVALVACTGGHACSNATAAWSPSKYPWLRIACALDRQVLKLVHRCFERLRIKCMKTSQRCISISQQS